MSRDYWNEFKRINKTRKPHRCACTGKTIPVGSTCWQYVGEWEDEFQSWYCSNEAKEFIDNNSALLYNYECQEVGEMMRERGLIA
jgi:hypothetical protein